MKVKVYFNLRKKLFSIQHKGLVVAHRDKVMLTNAQFKVNESGRQRVLKEKRKNVHAFVVGEWSDYVEEAIDIQEVTYNPYKYSSFVFKNELTPIHNADKVWLNNKTIKVKTEAFKNPIGWSENSFNVEIK